MDMARTRILHIKSKVLDTIQHDMLPIMKYLCIIASTLLAQHSSISLVASHADFPLCLTSQVLRQPSVMALIFSLVPHLVDPHLCLSHSP